MANKELMITLGLDSSTFTQKVRKAKDLNKELDKSFELLSSSSKTFENTIQGLGKKQDYLNKKIELASKESNIYAERLVECQTALEKSQEEAKLYADKLVKLQRQQEAVGKAVGTTSKYYAAVSEEIKATSQLLDKANKAWIANDKRVTDASIAYKNTQIEIQKLGREAALTSEKMSAMKADKEMKALADALGESQRKFDNMKNSVVGFDNSMEGLQKTQEHYNTQAKLANDLLNIQNKELQASKQVLSDYEAEVSKVSIQLREWEELLDSMDATDEMFSETKAEVEGLRFEFSSLNKAIEFHKDRVDNLNSEYKESEANISKFSQKIDATTKKMQEMNNKVTFEPLSKQIKELTNGDINKLEKQMSELEQGFKETSSTIKDYENTLSGLQMKQNYLNKALDLGEKTLNEYKNELKNIKIETQKLVNEQRQLEEEISKQVDLQKKLKGADWDRQAQSIEKLKKRYAEVNDSLDQHNKKIKSLDQGYNNSQKKVNKLTFELEQTFKQIDTLNKKSNFDNLDKSIKSVTEKIQLLDSAFKVTQSEMKNFSNTFEGLVKTSNMYEQKIKLLQTQMENYEKALYSGREELAKLEAEQLKLSRSCDVLRAKLSTLSKNSPEYSKTIAELAKLEAEMRDVTSEADKFRKSNNDLQRELNQTTAETNELVRAQSMLAGSFMTTKLSKVSSGLKSVGNALSNAGNNLTTLSFAVAGATGVMINTGVEFTESMSKVKALSGATQEEFEKLTAKAREMGAVTTFTAKESADALGYLALAGYDAKQSMEALPQILQLAQAGGMDLATATDKATDAFSSLGYSTDQVKEKLPEMLNMVASASANSNTSVEQMLDAFIKVGGQLENLNIPLGKSSAMLGVLANRGIKAEYAGNSLNSILINMTKASGESSEAMKRLGVSMFDQKGNIRDVEEVFKDLAKALSGLSEQEQVQLINMIGGKTQAKTLQKLLQGMVDDTGNLTTEYISLKEEIEKAPNMNALENMSKTMTDNLGGDIKILKSVLQEGLLTLFDEFEPQFREIVQSITKGIQTLTEKIKNLTPEQKDMIASFAKWAVIAPIALKAIGLITSGLGSLTGGIGKVINVYSGLSKVINGGKNIAGVAKTISSASSAISGVAGSTGFLTKGVGLLGKALLTLNPTTLAVTAGVAAVGVTAGIVAKELSEECVPEVNVFGDEVVRTFKTIETANGQVITSMEQSVVKISEGTKKAVGSYLDMDKETRSALQGLYINSTVITGEIAESMGTKFNELGNTIREGINKNAEESINGLNTLFANSEALSAEEKAKALENEKLFYDEKTNVINEKEARIMEILQTASAQGRNLKYDEMMEIDTLQKQMRTNAINTLSEQEVEVDVILRRMKDNDTRITAEMVSENIKQINEQKTKTIEEANKQYEEQIRLATKAYYETGSISEEQKEKIIEEAKKQKDEVVKKAEETHAQAKQKIEELGKDTVKQVDLDTGEIKSKWQQMKDEWDLWTPVKKVFNAVFNKEEKTTKTTSNTSGKKKSIDAGVPALLNLQDSINNMSMPQPRLEVDMARYKTSGGLYSSRSVESNAVRLDSNKSSNTTNNNQELISALMQQNQILMQILASGVNVGINVDGRQIARASAKYMDYEINQINKRKSRLGGSF